MKLRLRGDYYHVRTLPPAHEEGGIYLPDTARDRPTDAVVLAAGPGKRAANGAVVALQAQPGDRIVVDPYHFWELSQDGETRDGFASDGDLAAVIPAPDFDWLQPANDWVLVRPDPPESLVARPSGVIVAGYSVGGGKMRLRRRAEEVVRSLYALAETERFREQPLYYQHRQVWDVLDGLTPDERRAVGELLEQKSRTGRVESRWKRLVPPLLAPKPTSGVVVDVGPGAARLDGPLAGERVAPQVEAGMGLIGWRVHWQSAHSALVVTLWGESFVLIRTRYLILRAEHTSRSQSTAAEGVPAADPAARPVAA
ncbi:MAG TPA: co-chaperone GroES family protein [Armatimonadota bacterium]|nr:co-chaperone GroES family protein [Armatimonadota bacterium]